MVKKYNLFLYSYIKNYFEKFGLFQIINPYVLNVKFGCETYFDYYIYKIGNFFVILDDFMYDNFKLKYRYLKDNYVAKERLKGFVYELSNFDIIYRLDEQLKLCYRVFLPITCPRYSYHSLTAITYFLFPLDYSCDEITDDRLKELIKEFWFYD